MKKVFLIGDSIRIGYDSHVRALLDDEAQVFWSEDNARFVHYTLNRVNDWAAESGCDAAAIDLVHWNTGLWDILHKLGDDKQTPPEEYRAALKRIVKRIHTVFPNARIIFALTTQVVEEYMTNPSFFRRNAEIEQYNDIAREVMAEENIAIDDLYTVAADMPREWHSLDGTHFTEEGYRCLAEQVAAFIRREL